MMDGRRCESERAACARGGGDGARPAGAVVVKRAALFAVDEACGQRVKISWPTACKAVTCSLLNLDIWQVAGRRSIRVVANSPLPLRRLGSGR